MTILNVILRFFLLLLFVIPILQNIPLFSICEAADKTEIIDEGKRSTIHAVDGYAYLSEDMTLANVRAAAFANAKREALEMAKTYMRSETKVEGFEFKYDLVWSQAEGAVKVLEQKDIGVEDNTRYHVWIKAEVEYSLSPKVTASTPHVGIDPSAPLQVKVWTSKKRYYQGETIEIYIQGNRDFYARIVDITSEGDIVQLVPNDYRKENRFKAGQIYTIPGPGDFFQLHVSPPYGEDRIVVYASEVPQGDVMMDSIGSGLHQYRGSKESLDVKTRGIAVMPSTTDGSHGASFYEATWRFMTGKRTQ